MLHSALKYMTVQALSELNSLNTANQYKIHIITKLKRATIAYEPAPERFPGQRGRTRKKGEKVKLMELFERKKEQFQTRELDLYGKLHTIRYHCVDLL